MTPSRNQTRTPGVVRSRDLDFGLRSYMQNVFGLMAGGTLLTGVIAFFTATNPALMEFVHGTSVKWLLLIATLVIVVVMSFKIDRMRTATAHALFWSYSAIWGLLLATLSSVYTEASIAKVFFISAGLFCGMALYGYTTRRDLTSLGSFLIMGLWGLILAGIANWFFQSPGLDWALSIIGVGIFTGLTAYDAQKIKEMYRADDTAEVGSKKAIFGALTLYLDFINLFLHLLRIFGARK